MSTNFPGSNDVFNIPSTPVTTPLGTTGTSSRTHSQSHRDLGDALVAMQAEATYKAHTHDGVGFRLGNKLDQVNTHQSVDTDSGTGSLHHTIGAGANQYSSGTHTHSVVVTYPVGAFFFAAVSTYPGVTDPVTETPGLGLIGVWTAVGDRFLCASGGGLGFAAGTTGGSNSHNHTIDASTNTQSAHSHTLSSTTTGANAAHSHSTNGVNSASKSHNHYLYSAGANHSVATGDASGGNPMTSHHHVSASSTNSHSHSSPNTSVVSGHTHTLPSSALGNSATHSHTNSPTVTASNLIPLFVVFMWKRTS